MTAAPMHVVRPRLLLDTASVCIGDVVGRPARAGVRPMAPTEQHALVLPLSGMFTLHDGPSVAMTATPNHALLLTAGRSYGLSFPVPTGDHCLVLKWTHSGLADAMPEATDGTGFDPRRFAPHALLPPAVLVARSLLWHGVATGAAEPLQAEEAALRLVGATLASARREPDADAGPRGVTHARRRRQVARVLEAIAAHPERSWTLAALAAIAGTSPFHLARTFRAIAGTSVYDYVLRVRLGRTLDRVLEADADLASIALDAGFSSHSHYTARFRATFGLTPRELRHLARAPRGAQVGRIATAERQRAT